MQIDFNKATSRDFVNIPHMDVLTRASQFNDYLNHLDKNGLLNYRIQSTTGCGPTMDVLQTIMHDGLR